MSEMIELENGDLVPLTSVQRLRPIAPRERGCADRFEVYGLDGERLGTVPKPWVEPFRGRLMPAAPGWRLGFYSEPEDDEFTVWFEPIVAWRITEHITIPVLVDGEIANRNRIVVSPDGLVVAPDDTSWESLEEAKRDLHEGWQKARAQAKEASGASAAS